MIIKGGKVFLEGRFVEKDLLIENGFIGRIANDIPGREGILDASGQLVLPGLIDPHVHLREPGGTQKEDFRTGSRAAIAGGFTTVIDMPNNPIPTVTAKRLEEKRRLASQKAICDVLFHFGGTDGNFDEVRKADPISLKLYLGKTTGELLLKNPDSLERHFLNFPKDRPIVLHASDHSEDEATNLKQTYKTMEHALSLAKKTGRRIHIAHASTKKEIMITKKYPNTSCEVAPHHLFLSIKDNPRLGPLKNVYPPLRSEQKRIMLFSALGMADCIATDHAPHTIEEKENGAAGFPGLETSLALMLDCCSKGLCDKIWVARHMSGTVADLFGLKGKGRIMQGGPADITIADPRKEWKVRGEDLETKCKWSPFEGMVLKGKTSTVIKSGKPVYLDYQFLE